MAENQRRDLPCRAAQSAAPAARGNQPDTGCVRGNALSVFVKSFRTRRSPTEWGCSGCQSPESRVCGDFNCAWAKGRPSPGAGWTRVLPLG
jgi:hypothetical protein